MGWDSAYHWTKKSTVVNETAASLVRNGYAILAQKSTASGVWFAIEKNDKREILLALIKKHGGMFSRKDISESAGPSYYDCPISFFDIVPCPGSYATEWREKVKEISQRKTRELKPGMVIDLYGKRYQVQEKKKNSWIVSECEVGGRYRLTRQQLAQWQPVTKLETLLLDA